jgi:signal transduction histidine kinase
MERIRWPEIALVGGLTAVTGAESVAYADGSPRHLAGSLIIVGGAASLAWRRAAPEFVAVLCGIGLAMPALLARTTETIGGPVVTMVAVYSVAAYGPGLPRSLLAVSAVLAAMGIRTVSDWGVDWVSVVLGTGSMVAAYALGVMMRRQRRETALADGRAAEAERARERHAAEAVAAERDRIARDLHDVVAHAISAFVLQARGGRRMLDIDPLQSRAAFDAVEMLAGQSMTEMRRMLGLIRTPSADAELAPQPSLRHLDALVSGLGRPGLRLVTDVTGDLAAVPPGVDVAGYRIVQESLTNVLRHAGATTASVAVRVSAASLEIEVADDGSGAGGASEPGFGLVGMRERVAVYHGTLSAGNGPGGGFRVHACLPVTA